MNETDKVRWLKNFAWLKQILGTNPLGGKVKDEYNLGGLVELLGDILGSKAYQEEDGKKYSPYTLII